ncbi:MAG: hypothetical protein RL539_48, partial [Pseudomonadota bacterium]
MKYPPYHEPRLERQGHVLIKDLRPALARQISELTALLCRFDALVSDPVQCKLHVRLNPCFKAHLGSIKPASSLQFAPEHMLTGPRARFEELHAAIIFLSKQAYAAVNAELFTG